MTISGSFPKTTRAAVLQGNGRPLSVETLELPPLLRGQVLVKIAYSGLCGTQLLEIKGWKGEDKFLPHTLGHEASGVVVGVGEGISQVRTGEAVVLSWIPGPGLAAPGPIYRNAEGTRINAGPVATFSEYAIVAENRCTPVPRGIPLDEAALLGCAIPTGAGIVWNEIQTKPGQTIVIFGAGGVGLSACMAAANAGCQSIFAVDVTEEKIAFAQEFGATSGILAEPNIGKKLHQRLGTGADYAIECSGSPEAMEAAFETVKNGGGVAVLAGNLRHGTSIRIDPFHLIRGRQLRGTVGGASHPDRDFARYADLLMRGKFPFAKLITRRFALEQINEAVDALSQGMLGRPLLCFH